MWLAAYRCIEEDNFSDCKVNFKRCLISSSLLKRRQSVFPLFIRFICSVIVVFFRCFCTCLWSLCWRRCLRCVKRFSLCFAVSCCRRLLCFRWISAFSRGVSVENIRRRGFPANCCACCSITCDSPIVNIDSRRWTNTSVLHEYNMKVRPGHRGQSLCPTSRHWRTPKDRASNFGILRLAKTTRGSRTARTLRAWRDYKLASLARSLLLLLLLLKQLFIPKGTFFSRYHG